MINITVFHYQFFHIFFQTIWKTCWQQSSAKRNTQSKSKCYLFTNDPSYHLQAQYKRLCTLNFVDLSCFTHRVLDDISIVVIILGRKRRKTVKKKSRVGGIPLN